MNHTHSDYLDLLEKTLMHYFWPEPCLDCDGRITSNIITNKARGLFWPAYSFTMLNGLRLRNVREVCETIVENGIEGGFAECGVWRGGACIYARACLPRERTVYVCDSFCGFPNDDREDAEWAKYKCLSVPQSEVVDNFNKFDLLENVSFVSGYFEDSLPKFNAPLAVLRADGDSYRSTMTILKHLWPRLSVGGFLIMDDCNNDSPPHKAFKDYFGDNAPVLIDIEGTAAWCQKV